MSSATGIKFVSCKTQVPRKACTNRKLQAASFKRDESSGVWEAVRSAVPAVALGAAMLLSSGVAGAATLENPAYGGSVGGSDQLREVVQGGAGKAAESASNLLNDLPTPNLPTPDSVGEVRPASTIKGAVDKTVQNVKRTFDAGSDNVEEAREGVTNKLASGARDLGSNAPEYLQTSAENQARAGSEAKNVFEGAKENLERLVGGGPQDAFKSGARDAQDTAREGARNVKGAFDAGARKLQSDTANPADAASGVTSFFKQGAEKVQDAVKSGAENVQGAASKVAPDNAKGPFMSGPGSFQKNVIFGGADKAQDAVEDAGSAAKGSFESAKTNLERRIGGGVKEAFRSGANNLSENANTAKGSVQGAAQSFGDNVQRNVGSGPGDVGNLLQQGVSNIQDAFSSGAKSVQQGADQANSGNAPNTFGEAKDQAFKGLSGGDGFRTNTPLEGAKQNVDRLVGGGKNLSNPLQGAKNPLESAKQSVERVVSGAQQNTSNPLESGKQNVERLVGGGQEIFKTGGQRNTSAVQDAVRQKADEFETATTSAKGLADDVKGAAQDASQKAQRTGKSIFGF